MGILGGVQVKQPLHYGEVFDLWTFLAGLKGKIAANQTMMNHCGDADLHQFLSGLIDQDRKEEKDIEEILKANGVVIPPAPPERAEARVEDIPAGARITDPEISAALSRDIGMALVSCSRAMATSLREDIAMMFGQIHINKAQKGAELLRMNKEKGWVVTPPMQAQEQHEM
ncbi:DUF3231 family protein [Salsuginibacillus kocurii]|uniref:DUF3231 family protein n=1 Tax=Salsuginibacillus kocurii TaxID=427078 RepID=UPI000376B91D|nr:DUF3231 family protein [Salsuginibacillus kocurii]